jgi:hypothetical protein
MIVLHRRYHSICVEDLAEKQVYLLQRRSDMVFINTSEGQGNVCRKELAEAQERLEVTQQEHAAAQQKLWEVTEVMDNLRSKLAAAEAAAAETATAHDVKMQLSQAFKVFERQAHNVAEEVGHRVSSLVWILQYPCQQCMNIAAGCRLLEWAGTR